ncbi:MAG: ShlB/FhaC/HecB family hemolysin secretion/activation protein [Gammaproteobacteria bacterium]|nr:ShlB/FhaC/HecB family hemolysin secretion/activation protein [Gammaproteobacteria bacterium]
MTRAVRSNVRWNSRSTFRFGLAALSGLPVFSTHAEVADPTGFAVNHYVVEGENPLGEAATNALLASHVGLKHGLDELSAAAKAMEQGLRLRGFVFYKVSLPPQTITNETVKLTVTPLKLGAVTVSGNTFVSEDNVRRAVPDLVPGSTPRIKHVERALALANDQATRHIALNLKESAKPDTIDADLQVHDERPWSVFTNLTNVGSRDLARTRLSIGFQHNNLFDRDHALTAIYTTAPEAASDVKQFAMNYRIPWYAVGGVVTGYYAHSDVNSGRIQDVFDVSGAGDFFGFAYSQYLYSISTYQHQVGIGIDDRGFTNNVSFLGQPIGADVRSRPVSIRYEGEYRGEKFTTNINASYVHNTGGGGNNDGAHYRAARAGAKPNWDLFRYGAQITIALPRGWQTRGIFEGQQAGEPLIPGEQFGVGGANSVRGFEERGVTGDNGQRMSLEVWTPTLPFQTRLLGFLDAGHVDREQAQPNEFRNEVIISMGLGARWQWRQHFAVAVNYAHDLDGAATPDAGGHKIDFSILLRY